jgi:hypothetical protein
MVKEITMAYLPLDNATQRHKRKGAAQMRQVGKRMVTAVLGEERFDRARIYAQFLLDERRNKELLLIHQMGKVGSTSLASSLKAAGIRGETAVYQTHFLSEEGIAFRRKLAEAGYGGWNNFPRKAKKGHMRGELLHNRLRRMREKGDHCQVITLVRDPVATNVSGFFHKSEWWPAGLRQACQDSSPGCLDALYLNFMESYPHNLPLTWFEMEIKPVFGIDVFAADFPREQGYEFYQSEFADLLLIKLECLNDAGVEAIRRFLHLEHFHLAGANRAEDKWYSSLYHAFQQSLVLPDSYLEALYDSRFTQHFYTLEEVAGFRRKWGREIGRLGD